jgi:hypothetical protein
MEYKCTDKEIPPLTDFIWRKGDNKREGEVEEFRESEYVLIFYKGMWTPAKFQLLKRTGKPMFEYNWNILGVDSCYNKFEVAKYWMDMLEAPPNE